MDPPSIAYGCVSLIAEVTRLTMGIPIFVSKVRIARKDMDALLRELTSLQLCLNALKDDDQSGSFTYPPSLSQQINQVLTNTELVVRQVNHAVIKLSSRKFENAATWSSIERHEMVRCRSILESNRLALDLAVTMGTISKLLDQRKSVLDRLDALEQLSEGTLQHNGISIILEQEPDSSSDAAQLDSLRHEIADFRSQLSDLSSINVHENMQLLHAEAIIYIKSLLQPFPNLHAQLTNPRPNHSLSPSTSVSTATSSSAFTKRSHSVSCSTTSADSRADGRKCPACTRPLATDDQETAIHAFVNKQKLLRSSWQKQLEKEQTQVTCLQEEIDRLQDANNTLETGRVKELDNRVDEIVKEKDQIIRQLQEYLRATRFYIDVKRDGLDGTIENLRKEFINWERRASALSLERMVGDPTMSTGAPEEDGSDATTIEQPARVQRKPLPRTGMDAAPLENPSKIASRNPVERVVLEFSVNYVKEDLMLRSLTGLHRSLPKPVVVHSYKQWATADAIIREILRAATDQSQPLKPPPHTETYYITKVTQRYDNVDERPIVEVQPLASDQSVVNLKLLHGDKIRLMQGPLGFHLGTDRNHNLHRYSPLDRITNGSRQNTVMHKGRPNIPSPDENLPEVTKQLSKSPTMSASSTVPPNARPGSISPHVRSDSMSSYLQPSIVVSRALSDHSGISADTRISQPPGTLNPIPLFEFRVSRTGPKIRLKPRSLITNHSSYYSIMGPPSAVHHELMINILKQISTDPVHFTENDAAGNMKRYVTELLDDHLKDWEYDVKRIFLQIRSTLMQNTSPLREYDIADDMSIWVMLKPYKPSDRSTLGFSSAEVIPGDHELFLQQPDSNTLQRLSFNDPNFRRIYAARRHSRHTSLTSTNISVVS